MPSRRVFASHRRHDLERHVRAAALQVGEGRQRRIVGPLQVVEQERERCRIADQRDARLERVDRLELARRLGGGSSGRIRRKAADHRGRRRGSPALPAVPSRAARTGDAAHKQIVERSRSSSASSIANR
jgi:hypothetical protein